jgi:hypothetical protein
MKARAREYRPSHLCRPLHLCRQAATASKHWEVTDHPDPRVRVIVTATPIPAAAPSTLPLLYTKRRWHVYFVDGDSVVDAHDVLELAIEFWTHFIYDNGIGKQPDG